MFTTFTDLIGVEELSPGTYVSISNPESMGTAGVAFGGCTLAIGIHAAHRTVDPKYFCYSATGCYLGPSRIDRKLYCSVRAIRDTPTFATRVVEVSQVRDNGQKRMCVFMTVDFQVQEATLLSFSAKPLRDYPRPESLDANITPRRAMVDKGIVSQEVYDAFQTNLRLFGKVCDQRGCPDGILSQNLGGLHKTMPTTQDHLPLTEKTSAEWFRTREQMQSQGGNVAAMAWVADYRVTALPLAHNHMWLDDAAAISSLDFSLRFFSNSIDSSKWHLQELIAIAGAEGRTYSEARVWDGSGKMVAIMSQQSILRPHASNALKASL